MPDMNAAALSVPTMSLCFRCCLALTIGFVAVCGCAREAAPVKPAARVASNVSETPAEGSVSAFSFVDRTADSGIAFEYRNGEEAGHFAILESLGGGLAAIDFDGDGREDVCIAGGGSFGPAKEVLPRPTGLFRSVGDWKWFDVSAVSGVDGNRFYSHGIARTDFDNDGFADFAVTGYGGVDVYHNLGDGTFARLPDAAGLIDSAWSSSAAWADLNGDGNADLYLAHYVNWSWDNHPFCDGPKPGDREVCPPRSYTGLTDSVFFSNGDGTFRNATTEAGLTSEGKGLGVVITDLDVDGDNDVYVTNDTVPNFLYENVGDGRLSDVSLISGTSLSERGVPDGSMGVDVFDYNADGLPEVWVTNYERETNALYENSGRMNFRHVSQRTGINAVGGLYVGWGTNGQDFDLDGDVDMFVSNGHVIRYPTNAPLLQNALLFENLGGLRFRNAGPTSGDYFRGEHMGRGSIAADFDRDGDADLAVSRTNQPVPVLQNTSSQLDQTLSLRLVGTTAAREPIGAVVRLTVGGATQTQIVRSGGSYSSSSTDWLLFGIPGADTGTVDVEITWQGGVTTQLENVSKGQRLLIVEPAGDDRVRGIMLPD
jgi:hypothetical protein